MTSTKHSRSRSKDFGAEVGACLLRVHAAKDLSEDTQDAFVQLRVGSHKLKTKATEGQNPIWDESFQLSFEEKSGPVKISVWDGHKKERRCQGRAVVPILPKYSKDDVTVNVIQMDAWFSLSSGSHSRDVPATAAAKIRVSFKFKAKEFLEEKAKQKTFRDPSAKLQSTKSVKHMQKQFGKLKRMPSTLGKIWELDTNELEFKEEVGQGVSATVFKGIYRGQDVAIKVLKETIGHKEKSDFEKEFDMMKRIRSPNVVFFFGACFEPQTCIVLEWCSKGSLQSVLSSPTESLSWTDILSFAKQSCVGLAALHNWKPAIVHRDMKSQNLLISANNTVKICDFGLARQALTDGEDDSKGMSTLGKLRGTYQYTAPEIYHKNKYTPKADVFSFGVILWEMVARLMSGVYAIPFAEYKHLVFDFQVLIQVAKNNLRPTLPPHCPEHYRLVVERCWNTDPEKRPDTAELLVALEELEKDYLSHKDEWDKLVVPNKNAT